MPKPPGGALLLTLSPDPRREIPLHRQLYLRVRELILEGTLDRGARLPSSRTLAVELQLSRNTVLSAIEQLVAEGYLVSRIGDGTYVASAVPDDDADPVGGRPATPGTETRSTTTTEATRRPSRRGRRIAAHAVGRGAIGARPFAVGVPALDAFPLPLWNRLWHRCSRQQVPGDLAYGDPAGFWPLRQAIAQYVAVARGVDCRPEQVIVVSSSQQAVDIASRVLIDPGDAVWLEEPGYPGALGALSAAGAEIVPVPVDEEGLDVDAGIEAAPRARLVYVTPSHQYPTGATLSLRRRLALLDWAGRAGAFIVEDDYDSEFRYSGRPLAALQGLARGQQVIYVGTFTKVMFPALRVAYLVAPESLVDSLVAARSLVDRHTPTLPQMVLTEFIDGGHFSSHLRKMRALYRRRQEKLVRALAEATAGALRIRPDDAGMHLVAELPGLAEERDLVRRCAAREVEVTPLSRYFLGAEKRHGLLLGYTCVDEREIEAAAGRLGDALRSTD